MVLPEETLPPAERSRLADFDATFRRALRAAGYSEIRYFAVPAGFAMVTRVERMEIDGAPAPPATRWTIQASSVQTLSLISRLRDFFLAQPGHFRILVFIVSSLPFHQAPRGATRDEAVAWLDAGVNVLPAHIASQPAGEAATATVLVYEFVQPEAGRPAQLQRPGQFTVQQHLERAGVWAVLTR